MSATLQALIEHKNYKKMHDAVSATIRDMSDEQILAQYDTAGLKALYAGDGAAANAIKAMLNGPDAYGSYLRALGAQLLSDRPDFIQYFGSDFTSAIASRLS